MKRSKDEQHDRKAPGLVIRPAPAKYARPGRATAPAATNATNATNATSEPSAAAPAKLAAPKFEPLVIDTHKALLDRQPEIAVRLAANPAFGVMLLINPVLAFEQLGVELAPEIARHVLHSVQHPKALRARRDTLEAALAQALGEPARPTDASWNAHFLFESRKLAPLAIGKHVPVFLPPLGIEQRAKLDALRPAATHRYAGKPRLLPPHARRVGSVEWKESVRRLDLAAPAPKLAQAKQTPRQVPLEDLWFYKDLDPLVHQALELGVIQRRGLPAHTPDSFRRILEGKTPNAFRTWIDSVQFKTDAPR